MTSLENKHWHQYVWLDHSGEPRCQTVIAHIPQEMRREKSGEGDSAAEQTIQLPVASSLASLSVEADISGYAPRGNAIYYARPYRVYKSPSPNYPGLVLLCDIVSDTDEPVNQAAYAARQRLEEVSNGCPVHDLSALEIAQQFYITTKFVPVSFANNPPAKPGPFGSGVGGDLAVARSTITKAALRLAQMGLNVHQVSPLATPSHWGISVRFDDAAKHWEQILDSAALIRFIVAQACEEANLTPAFISKLLKDPWPPSVLKITAQGREGLSGIDMAKRLQDNHEELMRATAPTGTKPDAEVDPYVWEVNGKAPVVVVSPSESRPSTTLIDNRIPSSSNPYIALRHWLASWM